MERIFPGWEKLLWRQVEILEDLNLTFKGVDYLLKKGTRVHICGIGYNSRYRSREMEVSEVLLRFDITACGCPQLKPFAEKNGEFSFLMESKDFYKIELLPDDGTAR